MYKVCWIDILLLVWFLSSDLFLPRENRSFPAVLSSFLGMEIGELRQFSVVMYGFYLVIFTCRQTPYSFIVVKHLDSLVTLLAESCEEHIIS